MEILASAKSKIVLLYLLGLILAAEPLYIAVYLFIYFQRTILLYKTGKANDLILSS